MCLWVDVAFHTNADRDEMRYVLPPVPPVPIPYSWAIFWPARSKAAAPLHSIASYVCAKNLAACGKEVMSKMQIQVFVNSKHGNHIGSLLAAWLPPLPSADKAATSLELTGLPLLEAEPFLDTLVWTGRVGVLVPLTQQMCGPPF